VTESAACSSFTPESLDTLTTRDTGFALSPGEQWIPYAQVDRAGSDIMLAEGFG
jgi:hypothetical protein